MSRRLWAVALSASLSACNVVGSNWQRPEAELPPRWSQPALNPDGPSQSASADADFWAAWDDPPLRQLIDQALRHNRDLRQAAARVTEARALSGEAQATALPQLDATGSVVRNRASGNDRLPLQGTANPVRQYRSGFDASWEIDLFGRLAREREAVSATLDAAQLHHDAMAISLAAEVASQYFQLRAAQTQAGIIQQQMATASEAVAVVGSRVQAGLNPELDRLRAQDQQAQIDATLPPARAEVGLAARRLGVLVGAQADSLLATLTAPQPLPRLAPSLPRRFPAAWLDRRPDVRAAEAQAHAAQAQVGVAEGDRLPRLTLGAAFGWLSLSAGKLGDGDSRTFTIGPQLTLPLFHGGALTARLEAARARQDQAWLNWEKTAAEALLEVESSALRQHEATQLHAARARLLATRQHQFDLARLRYQRGLSDYTEPLEALRQLFAAQTDEVAARVQALNHSVALYKALGGGWQPAEPMLDR